MQSVAFREENRESGECETISGYAVAWLEDLAVAIADDIRRAGARTVLEVAAALSIDVIVADVPDRAGVVGAASRGCGPRFAIFGTQPTRRTVSDFLQVAAWLLLDLDAPREVAMFVGSHVYGQLGGPGAIVLFSASELPRWKRMRGEALASGRVTSKRARKARSLATARAALTHRCAKPAALPVSTLPIDGSSTPTGARCASRSGPV